MSKSSNTKKSSSNTKNSVSASISTSVVATDTGDPTGDGEFEVAVLIRDEGGEPYGCWGWNPEYLQWCRRYPQAFLVILCLLITGASFIQSGVIPASMMMWQRRFYFSTYDLAAIRMMFEIGSLIMALPVLYFGEQGFSRPQWIALGGVVVGAGAVLLAMPHYMIGPYRRFNTEADICMDQQQRPPNCGESWGQYKATLMIGQLLIGMGMSPFYILGVTFLDDNVTYRQSSIFTTIIELSYLVGPILGFIVAGHTVKIPGDFDKINSIALTMKETDHYWYGAWWVALLIGAVVVWFGALLMFPFPADLSGAIVARIRDVREAIMLETEKEEDFDLEPDDWKRAKLQMKNLLKNRVFIGAMLEEAFRNFLVAGLTTFMGKYLEAAFQVNASTANMLMGGVIIGAALVGLVAGSLMQHLFHFEISGNLRLSLAGAIASILFAGVFAVRCQPSYFFGENSASIRLNLDDPRCNSNCSCQTEDFDPICFRPTNLKTDQNAITFFSKCFAGCNGNPTESGVFCKCYDLFGIDRAGTSTAGICSKCPPGRLVAFMIGLAWFAGSIYVRANPVRQIVLRSVHYRLRTIAIALTAAVTQFISIPSPFMFSFLLSQSCRRFTTVCAKEQTCGLFHRQYLSTYFVSCVILIGGVCVLALLLAWQSFKSTRTTAAAALKTNKNSSTSADNRSKASKKKGTKMTKEREESISSDSSGAPGTKNSEEGPASPRSKKLAAYIEIA